MVRSLTRLAEKTLTITETPTISLVQDEKCMNIADHAKNSPFQNCQKQLHSLGTCDTVYTQIALFLSLIFLKLKQ